MKSQIITTVNILEAKEALTQAARIYFAQDRSGRPAMDRRRARPLALMGPPGLGKTEIVRQVACELDLALVNYSLPHHTRQSLIGLPRLVERQVEGRSVSMTEYTMSEIIAQIYRTMEETGKQQGILFLDEFNCVSESIRPMLLQLLQDKCFGPHPIPEGWMLVLAGNPTSYNRSASELDPASADRVRLLHIEPSYPVWRSYMVSRNVHPMVLSYLDLHPEHFYLCRREEGGTALVTARGWEDLSCALNALGEDQEPSLALVAQYLQCSEVASGFFAHWTQYGAILRSGLVEFTLVRSPMALPAVAKLSEQQRWSLVSALLQRLDAMAQDSGERELTLKQVHHLLTTVPRERRCGSDMELKLCLSSLGESSHDRKVRDFLLRDLVTAADEGWEKVEEVYRHELLEDFRSCQKEARVDVENTIAVCRATMENRPQLEFLLSGLCRRPALVKLLSDYESSEFRRLFQDTYQNPEAAEKRLLELLKQPEQKEDAV